MKPYGGDEVDQCDTGGDLGAALLSGALPMAEGTPLPLVLHPDPMMEFYKSLGGDGLPDQHVHRDSSWDPMVEEIETVYVQAIERLISFSPSLPRPDEITASSEYTPQSVLWDKVVELNTEATTLGFNNVINFGPGIQLTKEVGGQTIAAGITAQVADMILEERKNNIVDNIFMPCEQPILPDPVPPTATKGKTGARAKVTEATRRSSRQKA
jgi:hypothetical protein